jgi:endonuclease/exonuclease/phosphatase (EEP) superfamily protein YafD
MKNLSKQLPYYLAWTVVGSLLLIFLVQRVWLGDEWHLFVMLAVFTPILYLPAWIIGGLALAKKQRALAAVSALVVIGHLWLVWPVLPLHDTPQAPDGPALRIGTANVLFDNRDKLAAVHKVLDADLDVLIVPEYTDEYRRIFESQGVALKYPFRLETSVRTGPSGIAMFSRFPVSFPQKLDFGHHALEGVVSVGGVRVTVLAVHTEAPWEENLENWRESIAAIGRRAESHEGPVVVAGDFNATPYHHAYRDLIDGPLDDAAEDLGSAWRLATWRDNTHLPLVAMIDHVLVKGPAVPTDMRTRTIPGSDHRMLEATIRVAPF